ncbi:hypothetical protein CDAR_35191 [Caerostris darwini]|uniref:Uncharacterized protein n=1 Tax=Caerostris darwini TaxID=1538125 RepID=A0AAV4SIW1_9ARAC|nr:hypothetical protein CDAR_35191 [Caerostris darwini]
MLNLIEKTKTEWVMMVRLERPILQSITFVMQSRTHLSFEPQSTSLYNKKTWKKSHQRAVNATNRRAPSPVPVQCSGTPPSPNTSLCSLVFLGQCVEIFLREMPAGHREAS